MQVRIGRAGIFIYFEDMIGTEEAQAQAQADRCISQAAGTARIRRIVVLVPQESNMLVYVYVYILWQVL